MNNIQIPEKGIYKEYAGAWDEILPEDAPYIGKCLYMLDMGEISVDMFRKLVVDRLINRVNSKITTKGVNGWNLWANEGQLADTVNFFFKITKDGEEKEQYEVIPNFVKNLVPKIKVGWQKLYGPGDFLEDVTVAEFKDLLFCTSKWMRTKDVYWLDRMMAISYRRKKWFLWIKRMIASFKYEKRVVYNSWNVDFRIKKFEKLDIGSKYMFFYYVMGCMYMLKTDAEGAGIEIDGVSCKMAMVFGKNGEEDNSEDSVGMSGLIMALAESGVFGDLDRTSDTNVWTIFVRLYQLELERREFERKMSKD